MDTSTYDVQKIILYRKRIDLVKRGNKIYKYNLNEENAVQKEYKKGYEYK